MYAYFILKRQKFSQTYPQAGSPLYFIGRNQISWSPVAARESEKVGNGPVTISLDRLLSIDCLRLETLVHGSKSGICYQARRDGMNSGSTMNKACHKWFYSTIKPIVCSHSLRTAITLSYYVPLILCDIQKCCLIEEFCQELAPFFFFSTHTIPQQPVTQFTSHSVDCVGSPWKLGNFYDASLVLICSLSLMTECIDITLDIIILPTFWRDLVF